MTNTLTQERLKELLYYDQATGAFTWVKRSSTCIQIGKPAGSKTSAGYLRITVDKKEYRAHRLVWLYMFNEFPSGDIDHINGEKTDNRLVNLRNVTSAENAQNRRKKHSTNKTGFFGVHMYRGKYRASIQVGGVKLRLGAYKTPEEAHAVYLKAKREKHTSCTI